MPRKTHPPAKAGHFLSALRPDLPLAATPPRSLDPGLAKAGNAGFSGKGHFAQKGKSANRLIPAQKSRGR